MDPQWTLLDLFVFLKNNLPIEFWLHTIVVTAVGQHLRPFYGRIIGVWADSSPQNLFRLIQCKLWVSHNKTREDHFTSKFYAVIISTLNVGLFSTVNKCFLVEHQITFRHSPQNKNFKICSDAKSAFFLLLVMKADEQNPPEDHRHCTDKSLCLYLFPCCLYEQSNSETVKVAN